MLNSVSRGHERDTAEDQGPLLPGSYMLALQAPATCTFASPSSSRVHRAASVPGHFSIHGFFNMHPGLSIQWPAASLCTLAGSFVAKCLQWDTSPWIVRHPGVCISQKFLRENIQKILPVQQQSDCSTMQWGRAKACPMRSECQPWRWASPWVLNLTLEL